MYFFFFLLSGWTLISNKIFYFLFILDLFLNIIDLNYHLLDILQIL